MKQADDEGRLAQVLVAPIISESAMVAESRTAVTLSRLLRDATKPEIKAAVELMFKVEVGVACSPSTKGARPSASAAPSAAVTTSQGLRVPEDRSGTQPLRGGCVIMAVVKLKPTSPGRRGMVKVVREHLHKGKAQASLLEPQFQHAGPQQQRPHHHAPQGRRPQAPLPRGRLPSQQGRHSAKVERIEYDPNRTAHIALVCYADGERRYIIAPRGVEVGTTLVQRCRGADHAPATRCPSATSRSGSTIHCIEMLPARGAQIARSAGTSADAAGARGHLRAGAPALGRSAQDHIECRATIGEVSNEDTACASTVRLARAA